MQPILQAMVPSATVSTVEQTMPLANKNRPAMPGKWDIVASHPEVVGVTPRGNQEKLECSQEVRHMLLNARAPSVENVM